MLTLKKTKALVENTESKDSQPSRYLVLTRNLLQPIIKVEEKLIQLFKEPCKPFNLKLAKDWVKRAVEAQKANHLQAEVVEEDPALMKLLFLIPQTLMPW
jgi:hypothetical protein